MNQLQVRIKSICKTTFRTNFYRNALLFVVVFILSILYSHFKLTYLISLTAKVIMSVAFLLASKNIYFNYGLSSLSNDHPDIKCFEYRNLSCVYKILDDNIKIYLVCDRDDYFSYCFLMEKFPVTCLCLEQVAYDKQKLHVFSNNWPSPASVFKKFTDDERKIVFLYFFKRKRIGEIAKLTQLKEKDIYYRVRSIKLKLGAESTRKLPFLLKNFFVTPNMRL